MFKAGVPILAGIEENRLKTEKHKVKVKYFSGACTDNMFDCMKPLLWKLPDYIIVHIGTKDVLDNTSRETFEKYLKPKTYTEGITEMQNHYFNTS